MINKIRIIMWMISDFIVVISGIYIAFLVKFWGVIPSYNFIPFIKIWYLFGITSIGTLYYFDLYNSKISKIDNKEIILKSFKAILLSIIIMMSIAYIIREKLMAFPSSVFFLGIFINTVLCSSWRIFILSDKDTRKNK